MKYQGKLVLVSKPVFENKSVIELSEKDKALIEQDLIKKYTKLDVFAVGVDTTFCKTGDVVLITPKTLSYADTVELEGEIKFIVKESDIIAVY